MAIRRCPAVLGWKPSEEVSRAPKGTPERSTSRAPSRRTTCPDRPVERRSLGADLGLRRHVGQHAGHPGGLPRQAGPVGGQPPQLRDVADQHLRAAVAAQRVHQPRQPPLVGAHRHAADQVVHGQPDRDDVGAGRERRRQLGAQRTLDGATGDPDVDQPVPGQCPALQDHRPGLGRGVVGADADGLARTDGDVHRRPGGGRRRHRRRGPGARGDPGPAGGARGGCVAGAGGQQRGDTRPRPPRSEASGWSRRQARCPGRRRQSRRRPAQSWAMARRMSMVVARRAGQAAATHPQRPPAAGRSRAGGRARSGRSAPARAGRGPARRPPRPRPGRRRVRRSAAICTAS